MSSGVDPTYHNLAIGWDVGGWQGNKQAVAVLGWNDGDSMPIWVGNSPAFALPRGKPFSLDMLLKPAGVDVALLQHAAKICIGIDASLAFPGALRDFLSGEAVPGQVPDTELSNPLAYRDCERWIHQRFGKKPLSATFDKLGNNATLAQAFIPVFQSRGFKLVPQQAPDPSRAIIEAYPALLKAGSGKASKTHATVAHLVPKELEPGSDPADAALCALVAASFLQSGAEKTLDIPQVIGLQPGYPADEGWVYALDLSDT